MKYTHRDEKNMPWRFEGQRPISMLADVIMNEEQPAMTQYAVYYNPVDYPGKYVVRQWHVFRSSDSPMPGLVHVAPSDLESARQLIPTDELACIPHQPGEDPCIVETWI